MGKWYIGIFKILFFIDLNEFDEAIEPENDDIPRRKPGAIITQQIITRFIGLLT